MLYAEDLLFHIAIAAEAQQHWPLQSPQVSGRTLHYHYFAHLHMAAIAQVTGIDTSIVVLRLYLVPLAALLLLQVALLGRSVSGLAWAGPVAAALVALVGEVDLVTPQLAPFLGITTILLWSSPSYLLGLVIFVPLIAVLAGLLEPRGPRPDRCRPRSPRVVGAGAAAGPRRRAAPRWSPCRWWAPASSPAWRWFGCAREGSSRPRCSGLALCIVVFAAPWPSSTGPRGAGCAWASAATTS